MKEHLNLLGHFVMDRVTKFRGVVTSISFDISGCVQGYVKPCVNKGKELDGMWLDTKRLKDINGMAVMDVPSFESVPGGQDLPCLPSKPKP